MLAIKQTVILSSFSFYLFREGNKQAFQRFYCQEALLQQRNNLPNTNFLTFCAMFSSSKTSSHWLPRDLTCPLAMGMTTALNYAQFHTAIIKRGTWEYGDERHTGTLCSCFSEWSHNFRRYRYSYVVQTTFLNEYAEINHHVTGWEDIYICKAATLGRPHSRRPYRQSKLNV